MDQKIQETIKVYELEEAVRLSDFLIDKFDGLPSRKSIKKALKQERILVDGRIGHSGDWVQIGQTIDLLEETAKEYPIFKTELKVPYEDEHLAVVWKPANMPTSGNFFRTLQNALAHNLKPSTQTGTIARMQPVHRLDSPTSGLVIVAKTRQALSALGKMMENQEAQKRYFCICFGHTPFRGQIELPLEGKSAKTEFKTIEQAGQSSLVEVTLHTGRTHQIRKHFLSIGHPLVGDLQYAKGMDHPSQSLMLSAFYLKFQHPITGDTVEVNMPLPNKMRTYWRKALSRM